MSVYDHVKGSDVRVGDVLVFLGATRRVDKIEPYVGTLLEILGDGTRIASCYDGWGITLPADQDFTILPRAET